MGHRIAGSVHVKDAAKFNDAVEACWNMGVKCCPVNGSPQELAFDVDSDDELKLKEALDAVNSGKSPIAVDADAEGVQDLKA
jgi:hypothetical protein